MRVGGVVEGGAERPRHLLVCAPLAHEPVDLRPHKGTKRCATARLSCAVDGRAGLRFLRYLRGVWAVAAGPVPTRDRHQPIGRARAEMRRLRAAWRRGRRG